MLVIRLARTGRSKHATYRIVAAEKARAATGKFVEVLGHYDPHSKTLVMDKDGISRRVAQGAQPSNTVLKLMVREGIELPAWAKVEQKQRAPKKEPEVKEEATAEVAEEAADKTEATAPAEATPDASAQEAAADAAEDATQAEA